MATFRVPTYDAPVAQSAGVPSGRVTIQTSPETFGAGVGQALGQVANEVAAEQKRISDLRVDAVNVDADKTRAALETEIAKVQGENALKAGEGGTSPFDDQQKRWEAYKAEKLKGLDSEYQRKQAEQVFLHHDAALAKFTTRHQAQEQAQWEKGVNTDKLARAAVNIEARPENPNDVAVLMDVVKSSVKALNPGMPTEALELEHTSKVALQAVSAQVKEGVVVGDTLDHLFQYMTPTDKAQAEKIIRNGDVNNKALGVVQKMFYPSMTSTDARQLADKVAGTDSKLHKAIVDGFDDRIAAMQHTRANYDKNFFGTMTYGLLNGSTSPAKARAAVVADLQLSDIEKSHSLEYIKGFIESSKKSDEDLAPVFAALVTSDSFPPDREQMLKDVRMLGNRWGATYLNAWQQATSEGGVFKIPPEAKQQAIISNNLDPKDEHDKVLIDQAMLQTMDYFRGQSTGTGKYASKRPTATEIAAELSVRLSQVPVEKRWYGFGPFGNVKKTVAEMTPEDVQKAVDQMDETDKRVITRDLTEKGIKVTPGNMVRGYVWLQRLKETQPNLYDALTSKVRPQTPVEGPQYRTTPPAAPGSSARPGGTPVEAQMTPPVR